MIMPRFYPLLLGLVLLRIVSASEFLPHSDIGQVMVKSIPGYTAIESEIHGDPISSWEKGYREDARYIVAVGSELTYPIIVTYPEWDSSKDKTKMKLLVHMALSPNLNLIDPKQSDSRVIDVPPMNVASYAYRGAYSLENFQRGLDAINDFLKKKGIPAAGPPRHLFYSNISWTPNWFRVGEVEVPIPESPDVH